jgi:heptosyltransferase-3
MSLTASTGSPGPQDGGSPVGHCEGQLPSRILVIRPGALGDAILTLPAAQRLQSTLAPSVVDWMGTGPVLDWLPGRTVVSRALSFERREVAALFTGEAGSSAALGDLLAPYTYVVSYVGGGPGTPFAVGLSAIVPGRVVHCDPRLGDGDPRHMSLRLQATLHAVGQRQVLELPRMTTTPYDEQTAQAWCRQNLSAGGPLLAVHPGSGSPGKNWPPERVAESISHLVGELGARVVLLCGPADEQACSGLEQRLVGLHLHCPVLRQAPLSLVAGVLSRCTAYLGNDSGISHLAAGLGVPSVVLFGPTDPRQWSPLGPRVRIITARRAGWGDAGWSGRTRMEDIPCDRVVSALGHMLRPPPAVDAIMPGEDEG